MIANESATIVGLSLYIEGWQHSVQDLTEHLILCCKALLQLSVEISDLLVLGIDLIVTNCTWITAAELTKVFLCALFLFTCWTMLLTRGLELVSSSHLSSLWAMSLSCRVLPAHPSLPPYVQLAWSSRESSLHDLQMKVLQPLPLYRAVQPTASPACGTRSPTE